MAAVRLQTLSFRYIPAAGQKSLVSVLPPVWVRLSEHLRATAEYLSVDTVRSSAVISPHAHNRRRLQIMHSTCVPSNQRGSTERFRRGVILDFVCSKRRRPLVLVYLCTPMIISAMRSIAGSDDRSDGNDEHRHVSHTLRYLRPHSSLPTCNVGSRGETDVDMAFSSLELSLTRLSAPALCCDLCCFLSLQPVVKWS